MSHVLPAPIESPAFKLRMMRTFNGDKINPNYWICSLSNNQHRLGEELSAQVEDSSFHLCFQSDSCKGTVMVMDINVNPLTRSWCLYELLQTMLLTKQRPEQFDYWITTETGVLNHGEASTEETLNIASAVSTLRLQDAQASDEADKDMIDEAVSKMEGGFKAINNFLRMAILESLERTQEKVNDKLEAGMQSLRQRLLDWQENSEVSDRTRSSKKQWPTVETEALPQGQGSEGSVIHTITL